MQSPEVINLKWLRKLSLLALMIKTGKEDYSYEEIITFKSKWKSGEINREIVSMAIKKAFPLLAGKMINWLNDKPPSESNLEIYSQLARHSFVLFGEMLKLTQAQNTRSLEASVKD